MVLVSSLDWAVHAQYGDGYWVAHGATLLLLSCILLVRLEFGFESAFVINFCFWRLGLACNVQPELTQVQKARMPSDVSQRLLWVNVFGIDLACLVSKPPASACSIEATAGKSYFCWT